MTSIYIESADEITTVIERLKAAADQSVALVAPRGAVLLQSVVNLKLARKAAQEAGKEIVFVTTDKIGRNLCSQLGIPVAGSEDEAVKVLSGAVSSAGSDEAPVIAGVRIHNYYDEENEGSTTGGAAPEPIIIPKQLLKEEAPAVEPSIAVPAGTPEPPAEAEVVPAEAVITRSKLNRDDEKPPQVEEVSPSRKRVPKEKEPTTPTQKRIIKLSLFLAGVAGLVITTLAFLFLPITRVELSVRATDWTKELAFSASTDLTSPSSDSTSLPAELLTATTEKAVSFKATGSKQVGEKATGLVTFYNYSTTSTVSVPSGTTITSSGKTFVTTEAVDVPGYTQPPGKPPVPGTKDAPITANEAGPDSNLTNAPANNVTIGGAVLSFNTVNTNGGTSKTVTVVSADDINKAKADLTQQLTDDAKQKLSDQLTNREVTYKSNADILQIGAITSTVSAGDQADTGEVKGSATTNRTVVNTTTLDSAITDRLRADQLTNHTYKVTDKKITVNTISADGKILSLTAALTGKEAPVIPVEELTGKLGGKSLSAGAAILTAAVPTATIHASQSPAWWPVRRYPSSNRYILIDVKYE